MAFLHQGNFLICSLDVLEKSDSCVESFVRPTTLSNKLSMTSLKITWITNSENQNLWWLNQGLPTHLPFASAELHPLSIVFVIMQLFSWHHVKMS